MNTVACDVVHIEGEQRTIYSRLMSREEVLEQVEHYLGLSCSKMGVALHLKPLKGDPSMFEIIFVTNDESTSWIGPVLGQQL